MSDCLFIDVTASETLRTLLFTSAHIQRNITNTFSAARSGMTQVQSSLGTSGFIHSAVFRNREVSTIQDGNVSNLPYPITKTIISRIH